MAQYLISDTYMTGIANAIRSKLNTTDTYTPGEMSGAINSIPVASAPSLQAKTISPEEYQQIINADNGYDGLSSVTVSAISDTYVGSKVTKASGTTIIPSSAEQTAITANTYALNAIKVAAVPTEAKSVTANGTFKPSSGKYFSQVTVNVPTGSTINNQDKTVTPSETAQDITADTGYTGLGVVTVGAISSTYVGSRITRNPARTVNGRTVTIPGPSYFTGNVSTSIAEGTAGTPTASKGTISNHSISVTPSVTNTTGYITGGTKSGTAVTVTASELVSGNKAITANGTNIDVINYATVSVAVPSSGTTINNQDKEITPSESSQSITADSGYTGLGTVTVNAISSTYVGSGIAKKSSTDLTVSGATVNVPAGYYESAASKAVSTMTLPTAATSSATSGFTSKATISRSTSDQYINIPIGYNSAGAYYKISAVANGSVTAPSTISGTTATVSTGTNTITLTKTVSITPNVTTAGYISAGTAGNASVSLTASVTTKAAATITPSTTNQTIAAGTYLTGIQTISGDSNLVASNIISGKSIFGVNGSVVINKYYTGTSAPASSLGSNGDIYLQE